MEDFLSIKEWPGYVGAFTRNEALGAWRNGTRLEKVKSEDGDAHELGDECAVLGSMVHQGQLAYFVEWDGNPGIAVACMAWKLGPVSEAAKE